MNAGNIYAVIQGGTCGAASAPTGTGNNVITDGTVTWEYRGPTFTALAGAPTVSAGTVKPTTLGRFYGPTSGYFNSGAAVTVNNNAWFRVISTNGVFNNNGIGQAGSTPWGSMVFETDAAQVVIVRDGYTLAHGWRIVVDGRYVQPTVYQDPATGTVYITINFPSRSATGRQIQMPWAMFNGRPVLGVYVDALSTVWAPQGARIDTKIGVTGDSYSYSTAAANAADQDIGLYQNLYGSLGFNNVLIDAVPGTGIVEYAGTARIAIMATYQPDIWHVHGSYNDRMKTAAALNAAVADFFTKARAACPNAVLLFSGDVTAGSVSLAETVFESRWRQAIAAVADAKTFFIPAAGDLAGPWITGTGNVAAPTGVGNADAYFGADFTHPVQRGLDYLAGRGARAVGAVLQSLA